MVVRIRLEYGPKFNRKGRKNQRLALAAAVLLTPISLTATALALWRLAADMGMAGQFAITKGFFSHWQPWLGVTIVVHLMTVVLNRYGRGEPMLWNSGEKPGKTILNSGF